jgi:hypothetical protein
MYLVSNIKPAPSDRRGREETARRTRSQGNVWMPDVVTTQGEKRSLVFPVPSGSDAPTSPRRPPRGHREHGQGRSVQTYRRSSRPCPATCRTRHEVHHSAEQRYVHREDALRGTLLGREGSASRRVREGTEKIQNLDIFDRSENARARRDVLVTVTDGQLNIETRADVDFGQVAGIEITR